MPVLRRETGARLRTGNVPVTEIRAGNIAGPVSTAYEVAHDLVNHLPLMLTPRWVRSNSAPIVLDKLLEDLVRVARLDEAAGRTSTPPTCSSSDEDDERHDAPCQTGRPRRGAAGIAIARAYSMFCT